MTMQALMNVNCPTHPSPLANHAQPHIVFLGPIRSTSAALFKMAALENSLLGNRLRRNQGKARQAQKPVKILFPSCAAELSQLAPTTAAVYGTLLLGGGLLAYARTASKGSLLGGLTGGAVLGLVFTLMMSPGTKDIGDAIGFGASLLFVSIFGIRLAATRKIFPAAPLLLLSIAASAVFVGAYLQDRV